jgi:hypothetical protein
MKFILTLSLLLAGCGGGGVVASRSETSAHYQIVSGAGGSAWRLNTITGNVSFCQGSALGAGCQQANDQ